MADDELKSIIEKVSGLATNAQKPEHLPVGGGEVGPTTETKDPTALVTLPMAEDLLKDFFVEIDKATEQTKQQAIEWDVLLKEYTPIVKASGTPETVKFNGHFRNVHTKMSDVFLKNPQVICTPRDPGPAQNMQANPMAAMVPPGMPPPPPLRMEDVVVIKNQILNDKLGPSGVNGGRLMDELLFDVYAWAGIGVAKIGYRCVQKTYQKPVMQPDPMFAPPPPQSMTTLGLGPQAQPPMVPVIDPTTGQPQTQPVLVTVFEEYYARRIPPEKFFSNSTLKSTRFQEDATMLGHHFFMTEKQAMLAFNISADEAKACVEQDEFVYKHAEDGSGDSTGGLVHGIECWVKASVYTDEVHPQAINQLIVLKGLKTRPVCWRPSPDQEFDQMGALTKDSLIGFPIKVLTVRDFADSRWPKADSAFTNSSIKQLGTWRRQSVMLRNVAIGKIFLDSDIFDKDDKKAVTEGEWGTVIMVKPGTLREGAEKIMARTPILTASPDDYRNQELFHRDIDETIGISATQAGAPEQTVRSATETATVAQSVGKRNKRERGRVEGFWIEIAMGIDSLIMRYATDRDYVTITGDFGQQVMYMWNNLMVSGRYLYDIAPDDGSGDSESDFKHNLDLYNMTGPDPLTNRPYLLRRLFRSRGLDPNKAVLSPEQISMQPPHGGGGQGGPVDAHEAGKSGNRPNQPGATNHREETPRPGGPITASGGPAKTNPGKV